MFGRQMAYLCGIDMEPNFMGEPRIKDNISSNRDVLSSISWAFDRVLQGLCDLDKPAKPLRAPNKKRVWDAVAVDGGYGETFGQ
jgi:hypothetical protein